MAFQLDTASISHQLVVGKDYPSVLGLGPKIIRGSSYLESPSIFGNAYAFSNIAASVMIGPMPNVDSPHHLFLDQYVAIIFHHIL